VYLTDYKFNDGHKTAVNTKIPETLDSGTCPKPLSTRLVMVSSHWGLFEVETSSEVDPWNLWDKGIVRYGENRSKVNRVLPYD